MSVDKIFVNDLEKHDTRDINDKHVNGSLTVIFRDYDKIIDEKINMIYVSSVDPGEIKGPHLHKKRESYFICIHGKVVFVIKEKNGKFVEIESSSENPKIIKVPHGVASAHVNISKEIARILVLTNISWKPNDNEMEDISFSNYDWKKF